MINTKKLLHFINDLFVCRFDFFYTHKQKGNRINAFWHIHVFILTQKINDNKEGDEFIHVVHFTEK